MGYQAIARSVEDRWEVGILGNIRDNKYSRGYDGIVQYSKGYLGIVGGNIGYFGIMGDNMGYQGIEKLVESRCEVGILGKSGDNKYSRGYDGIVQD